MGCAAVPNRCLRARTRYPLVNRLGASTRRRSSPLVGLAEALESAITWRPWSALDSEVAAAARRTNTRIPARRHSYISTSAGRQSASQARMISPSSRTNGRSPSARRRISRAPMLTRKMTPPPRVRVDPSTNARAMPAGRMSQVARSSSRLLSADPPRGRYLRPRMERDQVS